MLGHCCTMPKFTPVTHVIFDLDGTIIDSEKIYAAALQQAVEFFGKTWKPDTQIKIAGCVMETTARIATKHHELECTSEEFCNKFNEIANQGLSNVELLPGAERLIRHFYNNNVPMAIATSSKETSYNMKTEPHRELFDLFNHVVCGGSDPMVKYGKPAPDIFLVCASRFPGNPPPEKCLVFEDSFNGIQGALAAGMQVVMIPETNVPYEMWKHATLRLDSLNYMIPPWFQLPAFSDDDNQFPIEKIVSEKDKFWDQDINKKVDNPIEDNANTNYKMNAVKEGDNENIEDNFGDDFPADMGENDNVNTEAEPVDDTDKVPVQ